MAEREGFEPPVPARGQRISSAPRSTTPAPLRFFSRLRRTTHFTRCFLHLALRAPLRGVQNGFLPFCRVRPVRPLRHLSDFFHACAGQRISRGASCTSPCGRRYAACKTASCRFVSRCFLHLALRAPLRGVQNGFLPFCRVRPVRPLRHLSDFFHACAGQRTSRANSCTSPCEATHCTDFDGKRLFLTLNGGLKVLEKSRTPGMLLI